MEAVGTSKLIAELEELCRCQRGHICELEEKLEVAEGKNRVLGLELAHISSDNCDLARRLEIAVKALEFYSDDDNWMITVCITRRRGNDKRRS